MVTDFWRQSAKISIARFQFCSLEFHSGWEDRNIDVRFNTADYARIHVAILPSVVEFQR